MRDEEKPAKETRKGGIQIKGISQPKVQRNRGSQHAQELKKVQVFGAGTMGSKRRLWDRAGEWLTKSHSTEHIVGPQLMWAPYKCFVWLVEPILIYNRSDF